MIDRFRRLVDEAEPGKSWRRAKNLVTLRRRARRSVAATPAEVVHRENKWRLLRYRRTTPALHATPILMVPSLINRHYILDLAPGRSFVEYLLEQGHDVFMIDWGRPGPEDRHLSLDEITDRYLGRAVRLAARHGASGTTHLLGYCLGGTLAVMHAASIEAHAEIASLVALAAPVRFDTSGMLGSWVRSPDNDVGAMVDAMGNVPWQLMQAAFHLLRPTLSLSKGVHVLDRAWDDEFLDGFLALERWGNDNVSFPGRAYREYIERLYRADALVRDELLVAGRPARLRHITCPTLVITFQHDTIVPRASAELLAERVSSVDVQTLNLSGGHVGAVVARKARDGLWPSMQRFWAERDGSAVAEPVPRINRAQQLDAALP